MINLETEYLGLKLRNPIIISSSGLSNSVQKIKKLYDHGAGAVVLKSLFEEQISQEAAQLIKQEDYPEAIDYVNYYTRDQSLKEYLELIAGAKKNVPIPVIASINCRSASEWIEFGKKIEDAGADAIELNIFILASDKKMSSLDYEKLYYDILAKIKDTISIPIAVKIGSYFTNVVHLVDELYYRGAKGVVLFNRFYQPDIDINDIKMTSAEIFSNPSDIRNTLRWVGVVSGKSREIDISASTGIHDGDAAIKMLLAGAKTVQLCSTIYSNGLEQVQKVLNRLEEWMKEKNFENIDVFRGRLNYRNIKDPSIYERSQFMRYFSGIE